MRTDNDTETRVAELIREAALEGVRDELPHSIAVTVEESRPRDGRPELLEIFATIHLERPARRASSSARSGARLKQIGTKARAGIEELLGRRVHLDLHVAVESNWQRDAEEARPARVLSRCSRPTARSSACPGAPRLAAAAFVMRAPIAIYPIGLVLIVSARTGHYGFAGVLSGVYVIANGVGNPALARLADRVGQRRLLVPASAVHLAAVLTLAACFELHWPDWVAVSLTVVAGFAYLSVGSLVRARWSYRARRAAGAVHRLLASSRRWTRSSSCSVR